MIQSQKDTYIQLLNLQVLKDDIHELLKSYKDQNKDDIVLSGNKSDNIANLMDAIDKKIISSIEIQELIKDSEEFGDQYIFLFEPVDGHVIKKYDDGNTVGNSVINPSIRNSFPKLTIMPTKFEWSDFRFPYRGIKTSWLLKMYDRKVREVKIDESFDSITSERTVKFKRVVSRLIYLVEWSEKKILEIKISRTSFDSAKSLKESIKLIKGQIYNSGRGINMHEDVRAIDLTDCVNNILINSGKNEKIYKLMSVNLVDSQMGRASIRAFDDEGESDLLSEESRKEAIEAYLKGNGKAEGIVIRFLASGSNDELKNDVSVIIGRDQINQIIIPAKIKPQEYRYVRRKIAEFS